MGRWEVIRDELSHEGVAPTDGVNSLIKRARNTKISFCVCSPRKAHTDMIRREPSPRP